MAHRNASALGIALLALALGGLGCAGVYQAPVMPPGGAFTNVNAPLDTDVEPSTMEGSKRGEASTHNILGLVAWGDASIAEAARDGEIQSVEHADYEFLNVLGIYSQFTTVVEGE